jgi:glycerophosphoryl diester phosphodiesterase
VVSQFLSLDRRFVIAHRGGAKRRPENTMTAFDYAVALGVDAIELDVHLSRDGVPVVIHDPTLARTTDASGTVAERTADELARLDAAFRFERDGAFPFRGQEIGVPTLEAVLARHRGMPFMVELKGSVPELARRVVDVVTRQDAADRVIYGSFSDVSMAALRRAAPDAITSAASREVSAALIRSYCWLKPRPSGYQLFQVPEVKGGTRVVSRRFVAGARRAGLPVQVWIVNEAAEMTRLLEWGVTGIISDMPDVAISAVR